MKALHMVAFILVIVGGLNWGLVGINPTWNLVHLIFGSISWLESLVYILVGISAILLAVSHKKDCKHCEKGAASPQM